MLPQVSCIIGPQGAGKSTLGNAICERTNMKSINYLRFIAEQGLEEKDEESITLELIKQLAKEISPRILLEDFPQTEFQARFFIKNCVNPSRVFVLNCSKDVCQERMITLGQRSETYKPSGILSKKIKDYNERCAKLLPFLREHTNLREINTE